MRKNVLDKMVMAVIAISRSESCREKQKKKGKKTHVAGGVMWRSRKRAFMSSIEIDSMKVSGGTNSKRSEGASSQEAFLKFQKNRLDGFWRRRKKYKNWSGPLCESRSRLVRAKGSRQEIDAH